MKAIIIGGGEIGKAIAEALVRENNEVCIVEEKEEIRDNLLKTMDIQVIKGNGCNPKVLKEARISEAQLVVAVMDRDEDNFCASMIARYFAPNAKIITRIRNPDLAEETGLLMKNGPKITQILNPEFLAAKQIFYAIKIPSAVEVIDFENGNLLMIGVKIPENSVLNGRTMKDIPELIKEREILFVARYRNGDFIIPKGSSDVQQNDLLYFVAKSEEVRNIAQSIGLKWNEVKTAAIIGANPIGIHLATMLHHSGISVKMIEKNHELASNATAILPDSLVLEDDPLNINLWEEENLARLDALACVSKDEELNLMVALIGKNMGIKHTAIITYKSKFIQILLECGITTVVSPRSAAISTVLKFLRKGKILKVAPTEHEDAEMLEYEARDGDMITGKTIREINFPKRAIIGAIFRKGDILIPKGETKIERGDKILILARSKAVAEVEKLMQIPE